MKLVVVGFAFATVVVGVGAGAGCLAERTYVDPQMNDGTGTAQNPIALANGALKGDFGPRKGFDGPSTTLSGTTDREWMTSTVTVARSEQVRGTGMVIVWTNGVTLDALEAGTHDFTYDASAIDEPPVTVNVCSGNDTSSIDYDTPVDHVTATVTPTSRGRTIALHTETHTIDPATGNATDHIETSDTTFDVAH